MKSRSTAFLLWLLLGFFGAHKFYLGKFGMGLVYAFTGGLCGIGWILDFFSLGRDVDLYNALYGRMGGGTQAQAQNQSIVVNVASPTAPHSSPHTPQAPVAEPSANAPKLEEGNSQVTK